MDNNWFLKHDTLDWVEYESGKRILLWTVRVFHGPDELAHLALPVKTSEVSKIGRELLKIIKDN